jgi:hypothetical protein
MKAAAVSVPELRNSNRRRRVDQVFVMEVPVIPSLRACRAKQSSIRHCHQLDCRVAYGSSQ